VIFEGLWAYEYLDLTGDTTVFKPMGGYQQSPAEGAVHKWSNIYIPKPDAVLNASDPYNYCCFGNNGVRFHPGLGASPCLAFIVPVSGEIDLDAAIAGYGSANTPKDKPVSYGCIIEVWVNNAKVWPAADAPEQRAWYSRDGGTCTIDIDGLIVKEGDRVRITATCAKDEKGVPDKSGKGMDFTMMPVVTYVRTGSGFITVSPHTNPPTSLECADLTSDGFALKWSAVKDAVSYNVYVYTENAGSAVKLNSTPVTDLSFVATGLKPNTTYFCYVTSVVASGGESLPSDALSLKTLAEEESSDTSTNETTTSSDLLVPTTSDVPEPPAENAFPLWLVAVGAIAVLAVIVVVLLCRKKK
ncbi:MAG: fibronectin type III domain-containing protein, partial [Clostridia bacterium]|nr:fibronectin type III domain-containing protein [Clostridia bacterium]